MGTKEGQLFTTEVLHAGTGLLELDAAELRVVSGPDRGLRVELGPERLRLGTARECEVVLHDATVSTRHAEILALPRGFQLRDLGSKNGVRLGPWLVDQLRLGDRMRLRLGNTTVEFRSLGRKHAIPLAGAGEVAGLVAHSLKMRVAVAALEQYAESDITVLLEGETGTGKEVAARALHALSPRRAGSFVVVDCGAIPAPLVAAELFGHEAGAFSGATSRRPGLFEEADGGTLLLDEVGELPLEVQPALLGALERRSARRVGGQHEIPHDVRVLAATHRNLAEEVRRGRFRQDLFYRLAVGRLRLPPLRERAEDLPVLAATFALELGATLTPELVRLLSSYAWPGNVRELRNTIARVAALPGQPPELGLDRSPARGASVPQEPLLSLSEARRRARDVFEAQYLRQLLARTDGNFTRAAELAGVSRQFLMRLGARHTLLARDQRGLDDAPDEEDEES